MKTDLVCKTSFLPYKCTDLQTVRTCYFCCIYQVSAPANLLYECLTTNIRGAETFKVYNNFYKYHHLSRNNCVNICTNGTKAIGKTTGALQQIKAVATK